MYSCASPIRYGCTVFELSIFDQTDRLRNAITIALELFILVLTCIKTAPDLKQIRQANLGFVQSISFVIWYNGRPTYLSEKFCIDLIVIVTQALYSSGKLYASAPAFLP